MLWYHIDTRGTALSLFIYPETTDPQSCCLGFCAPPTPTPAGPPSALAGGPALWAGGFVTGLGNGRESVSGLAGARAGGSVVGLRLSQRAWGPFWSRLRFQSLTESQSLGWWGQGAVLVPALSGGCQAGGSAEEEPELSQRGQGAVLILAGDNGNWAGGAIGGAGLRQSVRVAV